MLNVYAIGAFLIPAANIILWISAFRRPKLSQAARAFMVWSFLVVVWAIGYGITLSGFYSYEATLFWNKWCQAAATLMAPAFFVLACRVSEKWDTPNENFFRLHAAAGTVIAITLLTTPYYVRGLWRFDEAMFHPLGGPLYSVFVAYFSVVTLHGFLIAMKAYRDAISRQNRLTLKIFLIATGISYIGGSTLFLQAYGISLPAYGTYLILVYSATIGFAIRKYGFLDIRLSAGEKEKLRSLLAVTSSINHEIRSPLNFIVEDIRNFESSLKNCKDTDFRERSNHLLTAIRDRITHISAVTKKIGEYAHPIKRHAELEAVDALACIKELCDKFQNESVAIKLDAMPHQDLPCVLGDKVLLREMVRNFVENSLTAIRAKFHDKPGGKICIRCRNEGKRVSIGITDNGCGIAKENLERVFDIDYSTKKDSFHHGAGLFLVKWYADQMKAELSIDSAPGEGTVVKASFLKRQKP